MTLVDLDQKQGFIDVQYEKFHGILWDPSDSISNVGSNKDPTGRNKPNGISLVCYGAVRIIKEQSKFIIHSLK